MTEANYDLISSLNIEDMYVYNLNYRAKLIIFECIDILILMNQKKIKKNFLNQLILTRANELCK